MEASSTAPSPTWKEGRISRGWRLTQVAWALIRADRTMLVLAVAGIASSLLLAGLVFFILISTTSHHSGGRLGAIGLIAFYPSTLASVFFNVALASAASAAFDGEHLSVEEALRMAWVKRRRIALWALISVLVGVLVNQIASRVPGGARIVIWLAGAAWGLATIFVIPILALEGIGPVDALKRSAGLVKQRWGEGITGRVAIGAWSGIAAVPLIVVLAIGGALLERHPETGIVLIGLGLIGLFALIAVAAATQQVFTVALYRYAIDAPIGGFAAPDLEYPFVTDRERQKRKSWILRIGGAILGLFVVMIVIGIIFVPHRHTAADGYFKIEYSPSQAAGLAVGSPVVLNRSKIGSVIDTSYGDSGVRVEFRVDPRLREIIETTPAYVVHLNGLAYMRIGGSPPPVGAAGSH